MIVEAPSGSAKIKGEGLLSPALFHRVFPAQFCDAARPTTARITLRHTRAAARCTGVGNGYGFCNRCSSMPAFSEPHTMSTGTRLPAKTGSLPMAFGSTLTRASA
jgi:hypothetical protein